MGGFLMYRRSDVGKPSRFGILKAGSSLRSHLRPSLAEKAGYSSKLYSPHGSKPVGTSQPGGVHVEFATRPTDIAVPLAGRV